MEIPVSITENPSHAAVSLYHQKRYTLPVHEFGVALEILNTCRREGAEYPGARLISVRLAIGELTAIEPELLHSAWEAAVAGSPEEGSTLEIEWHPARQYCAECEAEKSRSEGSWLRLCPDCGMPLLIEGGDEMDLLQLKMIDEENEDE